MQDQLKTSANEWTILNILKWTTSYFQTHDIDSPRAASEILLAHALKLNRIELYMRYDQPLSKKELALFKALIKRRIAREPIAYIVGVKEFWSMDIAVTGDVLIPRPETEHLVETALSLLPANSCNIPKRILELGTGSGAIICALASQRSEHIFIASDRSIKAVELAAKNATHHNLNKKIMFFSGDWFMPLKDDARLFDMIISNPPYINTRLINKLQPEISMYEPVMALDGGKDGLCRLEHIIYRAHAYLKPGGSLLLEIGHDQKDDVDRIINSCSHYEQVVFTKDYSGHPRVVQMKKR
ncbi:MAG: peptide chain release factor N(5)-glutamine methyltransferase [Proteobacteria bacterium]|nr:peptide chain release factor N(5)-glutamine methyltransferase [Pseudomonadota bacterium]MBU4462836.1 peptide chain release factor N(5)-glutamine methyltransferase [Pseudomonadota bacterium]